MRTCRHARGSVMSPAGLFAAWLVLPLIVMGKAVLTLPPSPSPLKKKEDRS